ncbi:MAG TPA: hypothetical protein VGC37_17820 [Friedmanniella sp.]
MPDDDAPEDGGPPPAPPAEPNATPEPTATPEPGEFYGQRRRRRWPFVAVPVVALALVAGGFLVQHRLAATAGDSPATPVAAPTTLVPAAPGEQDGFALSGAGQAVVFLQTENAIQRADLTTGAVAVTQTPRLEEPSHLFAGPGWVASKTADSPSGTVVRDGGVAQVLPVALQQAGRAYAAGTDGIWALTQQVDRSGNRTAVVVDLLGNRVGDTSIRVPAPLGVPIRAVGDSLLLNNAQGTYEADPDGSRPISRGTLLGVGSSAVLTWDCNAKKKCDARINRSGRAPRYVPAVRTSLLGLYGKDVTTAALGRGVLSPDRRWVALELPKPTRSGARVVLVQLKSGHRVQVPGGLAANPLDQLAWTPNSRYLLALTDGRVRAFDATSEKVVTVGGTLPSIAHLTIAGTATI